MRLSCLPFHVFSLRRGLAACLLVLALLGLSGCAQFGYYWQSVSGHLKLMQAARPIDDWLADPQTPAPLQTQLRSAVHLRRYAVQALGLPDNASYQRYADLKRPAAVWNVTAAEPLSLTLRTWCFPVTGCIGYRGYYDPAEAQAMGQTLQAQGLETLVYGVPTYSTLGWLNWLGGDPLLNTFIGYPEGELARLIFHELAHQVVYVHDDTTFNESFATAVEQLGVRQWLNEQASPSAREAYARSDRQRREFRQLVRETRETLLDIYRAPRPPAQVEQRPPGPSSEQTDTTPPRHWTGTPEQAQEALSRKSETMTLFRTRYAELRSQWGLQPDQRSGYDLWVAQANNASFGTQAAYDALVPAFERLFEQVRQKHAQPWPAFYDAVRQLAPLTAEQRRQALPTPYRAAPGD
ncbi:aminopeptidase [Curvibacter sp. RS43]|uniref:aminopeptidase n=1 Tax=Curvibacter microcysteis TaxID=3026419 RepID=UPI0023613814|nr:aminopeptidase [Curvibacter sp. RS43]MDD0811704.1 aminopeptidase [Curvibacter sp. RS43]